MTKKPIETLAARALVFLENIPTNTIIAIGTLKSPATFWINSNSPPDDFEINGATIIEKTAKTVPKYLLTFIRFFSEIFGLNNGL